MKGQNVFMFDLVLALSVVLGCLPTDSDSQTDGNGGPQGTGCNDLIPIDASSTQQGITAENRWIADHYSGYTKVMQALAECGSTPVDIITIQGPSGDQIDLYFDISSFFGQ